MQRHLFLVLALAASGTALAQGNPDAAHRNKTAMCIGCHGIPGYHTAFPAVYHVPKIAGQQAGYIIAALKAYKSGERWHPSMRAIAGSLSDEDMADLAAYYSAPGKPEPTK
jgi:cytochrome c553